MSLIEKPQLPETSAELDQGESSFFIKFTAMIIKADESRWSAAAIKQRDDLISQITAASQQIHGIEK